MKDKVINIIIVVMCFLSLSTFAIDSTQAAEENDERGLPVSIEMPDGSLYLPEANKQLSYLEQLAVMKEDALKANNAHGDVVAWLWMDNGYLYQPLTYSPDDWYKFFHHDLYGNYNFAGLPFMSPESGGNIDGNSLLYGHNMHNGTAFGGLRPLKHSERFENSPNLVIYWIEDDTFYEYRLFTVISRADGRDPKIQEEGFYTEDDRYQYNMKMLNENIINVSDDYYADLDMTEEALYLQHCAEYTSDKKQRYTFGFVRTGELDSTELGMYSKSNTN